MFGLNLDFGPELDNPIMVLEFKMMIFHVKVDDCLLKVKNGKWEVESGKLKSKN